jgi:hypothetical protein
MGRVTRVAAVTGGIAAAAGGYLGVVTGALALDLNVGRRVRELRSLETSIAAPREVVFDVIAAGYAPRRPKAMRDKIDILVRGTDVVLAAHRTPIRGNLVATTTETVRFTRPERIEFRLVRGPVPYVSETFTLSEVDGGTLLAYNGQIGTDLWALGERWGNLVAKKWVATVEDSVATVKVEAERRAR